MYKYNVYKKHLNKNVVYIIFIYLRLKNETEVTYAPTTIRKDDKAATQKLRIKLCKTIIYIKNNRGEIGRPLDWRAVSTELVAHISVERKASAYSQ